MLKFIFGCMSTHLETIKTLPCLTEREFAALLFFFLFFLHVALTIITFKNDLPKAWQLALIENKQDSAPISKTEDRCEIVSIQLSITMQGKEQQVADPSRVIIIA